MPSSVSVSAACFMVAQSDWLPMMMATGFPAMTPRARKKTKAGDYRGGPRGGKAMNAPAFEPASAGRPPETGALMIAGRGAAAESGRFALVALLTQSGRV